MLRYAADGPSGYRSPMPTPAERNALLFVACVGLLGAGARVLAARTAGEGEADRLDPALIAQLRATDSAAEAKEAGERERGRAGKGAKGASTPEAPLVVDVDRAAAIELDRLPRIGPVLAARIVNDREANGPFGSLVELQRVSGVGPKMAERLRPHVTFSGRPRPKNVRPPDRAIGVRTSGSGVSGRPLSGRSRPP